MQASGQTKGGWINRSFVDAKGDLISASADDTPARVAVGTDGQILTADSGEAAGIKWATQLASGVEISEIGTATYDDVQDWLNNTQSAGNISGGGFTDNTGASMTVAAGTGFIKIDNTAIAETKFFDYAESTFTPDDEVTTYIGVNYNSGTPVIYTETTKTANGRTKYYLGKVFREGTDLYFLEAGLNVTEVAKRVNARITAVEGEFVRSSGMVTSETGERYLSITAGAGYAGLTRIATGAVDTTGAATFEYYYYTGAAWVESDQSQIDNLYYNDITSGLELLTANRYGVHWVYLSDSGNPLVLYGHGDYKLAEAEAVNPPTSVPDHVSEFATLIAKIIVQQGGTNFYSVETAFNTAFTGSGSYSHEELADLEGGAAGQYNHITDAELSKLTGVATGADVTADNFHQWKIGDGQSKTIEDGEFLMLPMLKTVGTGGIKIEGEGKICFR